VQELNHVELVDQGVGELDEGSGQSVIGHRCHP
jgi:hypothetical protein